MQGTCLCKAITIHADTTTDEVHVCHCKTCTKWNGGPAFSIDCGQNVSISGEQHLGTYASSEWAERGFCKHCGSHLFYRLVEGQHYYIPAAIFDLARPLQLHQQIFIDHKADFYQVTPDTHTLTAAEFFDLIGSR